MSRKVQDHDMFGMFRNQDSIADWKNDLNDFCHKRTHLKWKKP